MKYGWIPALLLITGCNTLCEPNISMPDAFIAYVEEVGKTEEVSLLDWWNQFDDHLLTELIDTALRENFDLNIAREKICQARAELGIEASVLWPHVDAELSASRVRNSDTEGDSAFLGGTYENFYRAGFDSLWEIDIFGKNVDRARGAYFDLISAEESVRDVHLTIAAEVALDYFIIRHVQDRIRITQEHIASERELLDVVEAQFEGGLIPELNVFTTRALLETRLAEIPKLESILKQVIFSLSVLVGEIPETFYTTFDQVEPVPTSAGKIPLGLPSELLCRRGDVRAYEFAMHASGARVVAARKELFPTLSLASLFRFSTSFFSMWFNAPSQNFYGNPSLTLPIFRGGEILSNIRAETSKQKQAVFAYQKSVLVALEEVESALTRYFKEQERMVYLSDKVESYREARKMSEELYLAGVADFLNVLINSRDLYIAEVALSESQERLSSDLVSIYKALGGGWECSDSP